MLNKLFRAPLMDVRFHSDGDGDDEGGVMMLSLNRLNVRFLWSVQFLIQPCSRNRFLK